LYHSLLLLLLLLLSTDQLFGVPIHVQQLSVDISLSFEISRDVKV